MDRRKFFKSSMMATGGFVLAPLVFSCASDDPVETENTDLRNFQQNNFNQGVASFDPSSDSVIIWTRFEGTGNTLTIQWELATDEDFQNIIRKGAGQATPQFDYTIPINITELPSQTRFYYRFMELDSTSISVVGQTLTLAATTDALREVKLAVTSCANYETGLFNVYHAIANSDAEVVVHLGDYIYENGASSEGTLINRSHNPSNELISLADYRERYKQYRSDKNLQLAHQLKPFICVWDDHEIAGNAYNNGAMGHQENEGDYETRKQQAIQAYSEYIPLRAHNGDPSKIYRSIHFGNLVSLHMLDTRITGRTKQLTFDAYLEENGNVDLPALQTALDATDRKLLGETQFSWLSDQLNTSQTWQVLGQQVLMAKMLLPVELLLLFNQLITGNASAEVNERLETTIRDLLVLKTRYNLNDPSLTEAEIERITTVAPYNLDAWDGYAAEREKLLSLFEGKKIISLAGDTHNAWQTNITNNEGEVVATELATASVSSPGLEQVITAGVDTNNELAQALELLIDDLNYVNTSQRGFLSVKFTPNTLEAHWYFVDTALNEDYALTKEHSLFID